ncbi:DUF389 domain-containing protein [Alterisphingorhabdus coralli]|uniref:DUF389 domain-containing protein n=1 Tax=Alterisphingorhabdus coralli TaxID=3071408 RepID=A0AA97F863_9SPHN|nr:DUF389 domain-containing protein [Parasphingorhabdus sp. SCSIO 66989]WOE76199.1 DUF389 domain-containing protein [Parasphingorhabdus sp. SCSIO 66989]
MAEQDLQVPSSEPTRSAVKPAENEDKSPEALREAWHWLLHWWKDVVDEVDHIGVINKVQGESGLTARYVFMTCMSAGIAILGLLLSSPAVVIGAMLLSPLMSPIIGAGFALAIGDVRWLRECCWALAVGILVSIGFCALIVLASPLDTVTDEIAARTRPNLFDLGVAFFSALAGAYAMIKGREGTIVGVAIATALMPPLAVVGFGAATANGVVLGGSLLLFFTNLMTIALTAAIIARLYGFRSSLSSQQTLWQSILVVGVFLALAVPLAISLQRIAWEANAYRRANAVVADQFGDKARVSQLDLDFLSDPTRINATVLTPDLQPDVSERVQRLLVNELNQPFEVIINQYRVGVADSDVEAAELAAARLQAQNIEEDRRVSGLVTSMAMVAGVPPENVVVDRTAKRAMVKAKPLPGAGLGSYYVLEQRLAEMKPDWTVIIEPPATALPELELMKDDPLLPDKADYQLALWAIRRIDAPVAVSGDGLAGRALVKRLEDAGVTARYAGQGNATRGRLRLEWLAPDALADGD